MKTQLYEVIYFNERHVKRVETIEASSKSEARYKFLQLFPNYKIKKIR